ncbi:hypothetical protein BCR33DRAFT_730942 [Rhizoclosmatium globosum]|uniref:Uncharacterized protein n=1 Tax=Rhizoclosmatium globosum TaxID=329046 RepID=A0A1Y2A7R0_9FUNG|nr:hypothetical protein BCR33DRAFT_730942 [Rhizoclosmatium globosum]|eukprot:ORY18075.1 hypothetical protein BCR33DRAFT_730942 [Rhizoclosmatium globosum]
MVRSLLYPSEGLRVRCKRAFSTVPQMCLLPDALVPAPYRLSASVLASPSVGLRWIQALLCRKPRASEVFSPFHVCPTLSTVALAAPPTALISTPGFDSERTELAYYMHYSTPPFSLHLKPATPLITANEDRSRRHYRALEEPSCTGLLFRLHSQLCFRSSQPATQQARTHNADTRLLQQPQLPTSQSQQWEQVGT